MRNVVLPVEIAEQLRNFLGQLTRAEYYSHATDEFANQQAEPFFAALDAALNQPEPFERLEGGEIVVPTSLQWQSVLDRHHRYVPLIRLREIAPSETDDPDDTVLTAHIEWTHDDARAVALALLEITEPTP